jgi:hypothetical protein
MKSLRVAFCTVCLIAPTTFAADLIQRRDDFTTNPNWQTFSTRRPPDPWPRVKQDFGWHSGPFPGATTPGQIGGLISRSTVHASYARAIPEKNLTQPSRASGKFRIAKNFGNSGILFGWFNETSRGWRTPNSLVFRLDGNGPGFWVFFEYGTRHGLTAGKGCFEGDRYQTTSTKPFPTDGAIHTWQLEYDPGAANDRGLVTLALDGQIWTLPLEPGHKADGASFNRFGILNMQLSGDAAEAWFADLTLDNEAIDLSRDPQWRSAGSHADFRDPIVRPFNDASWQPTSHAGGKPGEIGGVFWRDDPPAFFATPVGKLTLDDELHASGRIIMTAAAADSGVYLGWFNAASKTNRPPRDRTITQTNALAIAIEGPSRIGHYFRAAAWNAAGQGILQDEGPVIQPDNQLRTFSLDYSPNAAAGRGQITVTLDADKISITLPEHMRQNSATFDHFGFFNFQPDGHYVKIFLDDLEFTSR